MCILCEHLLCAHKCVHACKCILITYRFDDVTRWILYVLCVHVDMLVVCTLSTSTKPISKRNIATQHSQPSLPSPLFQPSLKWWALQFASAAMVQQVKPLVQPCLLFQGPSPLHGPAWGDHKAAVYISGIHQWPRLHSRSISKGFDIVTTSQFILKFVSGIMSYRSIKFKATESRGTKNSPKSMQKHWKELKLSTSACFIKQWFLAAPPAASPNDTSCCLCWNYKVYLTGQLQSKVKQPTQQPSRGPSPPPKHQHPATT